MNIGFKFIVVDDDQELLCNAHACYAIKLYNTFICISCS